MSPVAARIAAASLALALATTSTPLAGATRISTTATARDFLAGDLEGTTLTSDGRLTIGPAFSPRAWPEDAAGAVVFGAASDPSGRVFVATGGGLGRLFVSEPDGTVRVLFEAEAPNVTAVAVGPKGDVACATSPGGKLWRVDPTSKEPARAASLAGETGESAVWALAFGPDGTLYAGTGTKGRIWKAGRDGRASMHAEVHDTHVRSLFVTADGTVVAGTSDRGLVVSIAPDGKVRTLHDFARPEVVAVVAAPDRGVLAVATSVEVPPLSQQRSEPKKAGPPAAAAAGSGTQEAVPQGSVSVTATTSPIRPSAPAAGKEGNAEVVLVASDGFVEPAWILPEETVYGARWDASRSALLLATGPRGRVYSLRERQLRLETQADQRQAVAMPALPSGFAVVTATAPGVLRPSPASKTPRTGTYVSSVRDAGRLSRLGTLRFEGSVPKGASATFSMRSGNSDAPDGTWSDWVRLDSAGAAVPPARYFQWKAELAAAPSGEAPVIEKVEASWAERNARPIVENVAVLEPGAVYPRGGAASGTAVLSVTNPDELGSFSGLEPQREGSEAPGKKLFRKGFRTVTWKGTDPNGDFLRYDIEARREGSPAWFTVRKDVDDTFYSFDATPLPDGRYRFRVTASDRLSNPEAEALSATAEGDVVVVDATPPVLTVVSRRLEGERAVLRVKAADALSPVLRAEGTVSAERWKALGAADGILDGREEEIVFSAPRPAGAAFLAVRVVDAAGNVSSVSAEFPGEFR